MASDKALALRAGADYKIRIREFTLSPGSRTSEALTLDPNFGYVAEGTATISVGTNVSRAEANKTFVLTPSENPTVSNEGTTPLRLILVDVRP